MGGLVVREMVGLLVCALAMFSCSPDLGRSEALWCAARHEGRRTKNNENVLTVRVVVGTLDACCLAENACAATDLRNHPAARAVMPLRCSPAKLSNIIDYVTECR
ncbi:MAG: hypothetical protein Udaeo2_12580 [Candidatus Udaeobacter sp.]|nr:MAG: hypothetical protein Udaeo2_12580 [Candidatus Udaeobacter sp.]